MPMNAFGRAILFKRETVYGTDAAPTAAADGVEVFRNPRVTPLELGYVDRDVLRSFFGNFQQLVSTKFVRVGFEVPLAGFGSAGPASPTAGYDALLRACGTSRTISAGVSVTYTPATTNLDSGTMYYYKDGRIHKLKGARGNVQLQFRRNQIPRYVFDFIGLDGGIVDGALVVPVISAYQTPLICKSGADTLSLHGLATAALESCSIDLGQSLVYRNLMNVAEEVRLNGRQASGEIEIEDNLVVVKDWWSTIQASTLGAFDLTHGTVAGNIVQVTSSSVQLTTPRENDVDEVAHLQMAMRFVPTGSGNNELSIIVK